MRKISNKDILQSYILTTAKYDYSVYEKRILYRLVEIAQSEIEGLKFSNDCRKVEHDLFGLVSITLPISSILANENDKNYKKAKDALISLSQKYIIYEDSEVWEKINIVVLPRIEKRKSTFTFTISPRIWDCILNFSKGYRKFELKTAMQFESVYAMRFYELVSGQESPITYNIDTLKDLFQISGKYKKINDFIKRVIEPAKTELDKCSPYTFNYNMNKTGRTFTSVTLFPKYQAKYRDEDLETHTLQKQISLSWDLPKDVVDYLKHNFGFTTDGIKNNIDLFKLVNDKIDLIQFLANIKGKARDSNNPQGYIVGAIRKQI
jgi:hypothetical protein